MDKINQNDVENLITENVNRFDDFAAFMPFFIVGPVQLGFTIFYLTYYINYTILGGLIMLCSFVFVLLITGKAIEYFKYYIMLLPYFYKNHYIITYLEPKKMKQINLE